MMQYRRVAQLRTSDDFRSYLDSLSIDLAFDETMQAGSDAPLSQPFAFRDKSIGNRFAVLPMEGWDGTLDGHVSDLVQRRWQRFGQSGAKLIWGGEAVAVRHDGRANPHQLVLNAETFSEFVALREMLFASHAERYGSTDDVLIGLQLTHSGRFARPTHHDQLEPKILYRHPLLDRKFHVSNDFPLMSD
ncbi:MAG: NADH:flavin oxidoreductase, partial [Burkholderiales bacterium]|nr:NADH:flavin oxidoreductase [Anaerolineae bacterium]